jgi:butyryl-CoA dehydrogenase
MDELLPQETQGWARKAHEIAEEIVRPLAAKYDRLQEYPWEIKDVLAKEGFFGIWIPQEYGGAGGPHRILNLCVAVEQLSRACGGVGVLFAVNALGSIPIIIGGREEQKKRYLPLVAMGEKLAAFCLSEKAHGSDAAGMQTRAIRDGDFYVIDGEKKWTSNGGAADLYTVFAVTDPQSKSRRISAILVEKGTPGFSFKKVEDKMGIRCVPVVETLFKGCKVPTWNLLGQQEGYGFRLAMQTLDIARPGVAAQAVGLAQGAIDFALVYASRRYQFGQPILSHQTLQHALAEMASKVEAARRIVYASAAAVDLGLANVTKLAAQAKYFATETAMEVTTKAVQMFGGYGYMKDYPIEKYMRDAKITQIYEGTNEIQKLVIGRFLQKEVSTLSYLEKYIPVETQYILQE